jgi:hypothetical protein
MGNWSIHIEGTGVHDNERPDDADILLREFVNVLAMRGQSVQLATITVGSTRELTDANDMQTGRIESPSSYRYRG